MESYTIDPANQHENSLKLLEHFHAYRVAYKYINSQPIHAFFVIPKELPKGPRPLLVRYHGGGWTEGEAEASLRPFFLEMALKHGAVILTPDYRLRPEHEITEGLDDLRSFWQWIEQRDAQQVVHKSYPDLELDVNNLLVGGESAGGYLTLQTALLPLTKLPINILFVQYPVADVAGCINPPDLDGDEVPGAWLHPYPYSVVEEHLAALKPGKICTRAKFGGRMTLHFALTHAGRLVDISGDKAWLDPMSSLDTAGPLPPILLYHSKEDEAIPWQHTERWASKAKKLQPDVPLHLTWQTGTHTFDANHTMATPWLKEPLEFVQKYWPTKE